MEVDRAAYAAVAKRIDAAMRALGAWRSAEDDPGHPAGAFGGPYQSATEWIQFTLLPHVQAIAASKEDPPEHSDAGVMAVREFDGYDAADDLVVAVLDLDRL